MMASAKSKANRITKPAPLKAGHILSEFASREKEMNVWLREHALKAVESNTATTFVTCRGKRAIGYYSLAAGCIAHEGCTSSLRRNAPDPVPAFILARLAVTRIEEGQGLGTALVQDAMRRCLAASKQVAARTLLVHALNDEVVSLYKNKLGFLELPVREGKRALHLPIKTIANALIETAKVA